MNFSPAFKKLLESVSPTEMQQMLDTMSLYKIYKTLKISDKLLIKYLIHHNLNFKKSFRTINDLSKDEKNQIIKLWTTTNITKKDLFKKFSIGKPTLKKILKENSIDEYSLNRNSSQIDKDWLNYQKLVLRLTMVVKRYYNLTTPIGFDWDHKLSIKDGYIQKIHPNLIASRENLELIPSSSNRSNGEISSITKEKLLSLCNIYSSP